MARDPRTEPVTARVFFVGVMFMCKNAKNQCEVGFFPCPLHSPVIKTREFRSGKPTGLEVSYPVVKDMYIRAINPETPGIAIHRDPGNPTDFGFVPDFDYFHGNPVRVRLNLLNGRVGITSGLLYTHELTLNEYDLVDWSVDPSGVRVTRIGKMAKTPALNIACLDGVNSGVDIVENVTGQVLTHLPKQPNTHYEIEITNDCGDPPADQTDYRLYYSVVYAPDTRKFDFKQAVRDPSPEVCLETWLSGTNTLGLDVKP